MEVDVFTELSWLRFVEEEEHPVLLTILTDETRRGEVVAATAAVAVTTDSKREVILAIVTCKACLTLRNPASWSLDSRLFSLAAFCCFLRASRLARAAAAPPCTGPVIRALPPLEDEETSEVMGSNLEVDELSANDC